MSGTRPTYMEGEQRERERESGRGRGGDAGVPLPTGLELAFSALRRPCPR